MYKHLLIVFACLFPVVLTAEETELRDHVDRAEGYTVPVVGTPGGGQAPLTGTTGTIQYIGNAFEWEGDAEVSEVLVLFAGRMNTNSNPQPFHAAIFEAEANGYPATNAEPLGKAYFTHDDVEVDDLSEEGFTSIPFDQPVSVDDNFVAAIMIDSLIADDRQGLVLATSNQGDGAGEERLCIMYPYNADDQGEPYYIPGKWSFFDEYFSYFFTGDASAQSFDTDLMIIPVLTTATNLTNTEKRQTITNLYPNPAQHYINIPLPAQRLHDITFEVYDLQGRQLTTYSITTESQEAQLDITALPPGHYYLMMHEKQNSTAVRFTVEQ